VEFPKTPVGSNGACPMTAGNALGTFDRRYPANAQWSNKFDPTGEGSAGARGLK
jgi:hypothetical protein